MQIQFWSESDFLNFGMVVSLILFFFLFFLFVTMLRSFFKKPIHYKKYTSKVSVIVPAYNEEENIKSCLASIVNSDYSKYLIQVIVVDDGSTDRIVKIAKQFANAHRNVDISVLECPHYGKSEAVNFAIRKSKHSLILSVDADVELGKDTISKLILPLQDKKVAAANAVAAIRHPKGLLGHFQLLEFSLNNLIRSTFSNVFDNSIWFYGVVAAYRKDALEKVGIFKADTLTEDMDLCLELYWADYNIVTVRDALITTRACPDLKSFFRQRMRWYFGALQSLYKNKTLLTLKKKSASVKFLFFNQLWWTLFAFLFFPLTAYQVAYWFPSGGLLEPLLYLVRWFSIWGPFYVIYKIPEWGLNFMNIFGVLSGILTLVMLLVALFRFWVAKEKVRFTNIFFIALGIFFYFPFTIMINLTIVFGIAKYMFSDRKYFG